MAGDQISVDGNEGTVEAITIRETQIRRYDGQLLVVPNRDVYKNTIRAQTNRSYRRAEFTVGVSHGSDLNHVRATILAALNDLKAVRAEPAPSVLLSGFNTSTMDFVARLWVGADQADALNTVDQSLQQVKEALDREAIEIPTTIITLEAAEGS